MSKVLIGYFSKTGSTKEIAERIGANLAKKGVESDVLELEKIKNIENYSSVILGAPINGMKHVPEFVKFVEENKTALDGKVAGLFTVAYIYYDGRSLWRSFINKSIAKIEKLINPKNSIVFAGRIDKKMPAFANLLFGIGSDLPNDLINHEEIDKWSEGI
ncbi:flavodoxin domain-containing protein [bacterium]|nr:flavodoxin domain-containing protein [bacterium]